MSSSCTTVVPELVVWVNNPEASRVDIWVEQAVGHSCENCKIVLNNIVHLHPILKEECQALDIVGNIVLYSSV